MQDLLLMELLNKYALVAFLILYLRIKQTYPPHHRQCWTTEALSAFLLLHKICPEKLKRRGTERSRYSP